MIIGDDVKLTPEKWAEMAAKIKAQPELIPGMPSEWQKHGAHRYRISADRKCVQVMFGYGEGAGD